jgi:hypothetical protein
LGFSNLKYLVITCLLIGLGYGQSSHRNLSTELLKDLHQAIADSTSIPGDRLQLKFIDDSNLGNFLNTCLPEATNPSGLTNNPVTITIRDVNLSINHASKKTVRNSGYLRQLELNVLFSHMQTEYVWQGKISDNLSKGQLKSLLEDDFPIRITGDYLRDEPAVIMIVLTTLSVFSLGAALFFIRT